MQTPKTLVSRMLNNEILMASLIIILALAFFYHDVVFGGKTFLVSPNFSGVISSGPYGYTGTHIPMAQFILNDPGAIYFQYEPWTREIYRTLTSGELPLWSPYQGLGAPLHANAQTGVFDPLLLIVNLAPDSLFPYTNDLQLLFRYYLAGLFTFLFVRALGVGLIGAFAAAFGYLFSSFFLVYGNISLVRPDLLLPLLMYGVHKFSMKQSWGTFWLVTLAWWLIIVGGFPESLPFPVLLAFCWWLLTVGIKVVKHKPILSRENIIEISRIIWPFAVGTALGAFVLLPFTEYFFLSDHRGAATFPFWKSLRDIAGFVLVSIFPILRQSGGLYPYNILLVLLALSALIAYLINRKRFNSYVYFSRTAGLMLIIVGLYIVSQALPLINKLPVLNIIALQRHLQPLVVFCVACVAGFGLDWWSRKKTNDTVIFFLTVGVAFFFLIIFVDAGSSLLIYPFGERRYRDTLLVILSMLATFCFLSWVTTRFSIRRVPIAASLVLFSIIVMPLVWYRETERPERYDPFISPPFVEYLQSISDGSSRMFGFDPILIPNTSSAYGIDDIRYLSATFPDQFVKIVEETLYTETDVSRFSGREPHIFFDRVLNLLNIEYVVVPQVAPDALINRVNPIEGQVAGLPHKQIELDEAVREVVNDGSQSPFSIKFRVSPGTTHLDVSYGVDPEAWECNCGLSDGVSFRVELYDLDSETGSPHILFERQLDPVQNPEDRHWFSEQLDLTAWSGHEIELWFYETSVSEDARLDWVYWGIPDVTTYDYTFPLSVEPDGLVHQPISHLFGLPVSVDPNSDSRMIFRHAPASMQASFVVPEDARLEVDFGLAEEAWNDETPGDGVTFSMSVIDNHGEQQIFERYIDPKHNPDDRQWHPVTLDLSPWSGENITIRFDTDPGPLGDTGADWSYWSNPTLIARDIDTTTDVVQNLVQFESVYTDEFVQIFRNRLAFPRAFVVYQAEQVANVEETIARLESVDFNPSRLVLIEGDLPQAVINNLATIDPSILPTAAEVVERTANSLRLSVNTEQPGMLVVSEQYFPGWEAQVDGKPAEIYLADGMMRAVYLDAGEHLVEFHYHPQSFTYGILLGLGVLVFVSIWYIVSARLNR